jgi:hypothetical protein
MRKIVDVDDDDDDYDDDATFPFQRARDVIDICNPKDIQDSIKAICVTSVDVTPKFVRTQ